jgi:hypothetical protein
VSENLLLLFVCVHRLLSMLKCVVPAGLCRLTVGAVRCVACLCPHRSVAFALPCTSCCSVPGPYSISAASLDLLCMTHWVLGLGFMSSQHASVCPHHLVGV